MLFLFPGKWKQQKRCVIYRDCAVAGNIVPKSFDTLIRGNFILEEQENSNRTSVGDDEKIKMLIKNNSGHTTRDFIERFRIYRNNELEVEACDLKRLHDDHTRNRKGEATWYVLSINYSCLGTSDNKTDINVNNVNETATEKQTTKQSVFIEIRKWNLK